MEKISFKNPANSPSPLAQQLKQDPVVQEYLRLHQLDASLIDDHAIAFRNWLAQKQICDQCHGLHMCTQPDKGYRLELDEEGNAVMRPCPYKNSRQQALSHKANYLLNDLPDSALTNDIYQLDLSCESRDYLSIVSWVKQWLDEKPEKGFYFYGGLGVGKTFLASCITNQMAKEGYKVAFVKVPTLVSDLKSNLKEYGYVESRLRKMKRADVLVLDDIGAENISEWIRDDILFAVLDYRMENSKHTIFTSNSDLDSLKRRMMITNNNEDETKALRIIERIRTLSFAVGIKGISRRSL